jgi:hypothetical protein
MTVAALNQIVVAQNAADSASPLDCTPECPQVICLPKEDQDNVRMRGDNVVFIESQQGSIYKTKNSGMVVWVSFLCPSNSPKNQFF